MSVTRIGLLGLLYSNAKADRREADEERHTSEDDPSIDRPAPTGQPIAPPAARPPRR
jgi:hypothetical protein